MKCDCKLNRIFLLLCMILVLTSCENQKDANATSALQWHAEAIEYPSGCKNLKYLDHTIYGLLDSEVVKIDPYTGQVMETAGLPNLEDGTLLCLAYSEEKVCYIVYTLDADQNPHFQLCCMDWQGNAVFSEAIETDGALSNAIAFPSDIAIGKAGETAVAVDCSLYLFDASGEKTSCISLDAKIEKLMVSPTYDIYADLSTGQICNLKTENVSFTAVVEINAEANDISVGGEAYDFIVYDANACYGADIKGKSEKIAEWEALFLSSLEIIQIVPLEQDTLLLDYIDPISNTTQLIQLKKGEVRDLPVLTIAQIGVLDDNLRLYVAACNRRNLGAKYEAVLYEDMDALKKAIVSGEGPDIIYSDYDDLSYEVLENIGALMDLYPLIDANTEFQREDFTAGYLSCMEKEGQLHTISVGFQLQGIAAKKKSIANSNRLTMTQLLKEAKQLSGDVLIADTTQVQFLSDMLEYCIEEYVNFKEETCDFDNASFRALLELAKDYVPNVSAEQNEGALIQWFGLYDFQESIKLLNMGFEALAIPDCENYFVMMPMGSCFSISAVCQNPELAWNAIRLMLSDSMQYGYNSGFAYPVLQCIYDQMAEQALEQKNITEKQVERIKKETMSAHRRIRNSPAIAIILEEAAACFSGDKTIDEIIQLIENRVNIYLSEQGD